MTYLHVLHHMGSAGIGNLKPPIGGDACTVVDNPITFFVDQSDLIEGATEVGIKFIKSGVKYASNETYAPIHLHPREYGVSGERKHSRLLLQNEMEGAFNLGEEMDEFSKSRPIGGDVFQTLTQVMDIGHVDF